MSDQNCKNVLPVAINKRFGWLETTGNRMYTKKKNDFKECQQKREDDASKTRVCVVIYIYIYICILKIGNGKVGRIEN